MEDEDLSKLTHEELVAKVLAQQAELQAVSSQSSNPSPDAPDDSGDESLQKAISHHFQKLALSPDAVTLLTSYLKTLRNDCLHLALAQLGEWQAVAGKEERLELHSIYTELRTKRSVYDLDGKSVSGMEELHSTNQEERKPLSAPSFAASYPKAVLLGDPGSGKSTFVTMLTLCLVGELLDDQDVNLSLMPEWVEPIHPDPDIPADRSPKLLPLFLTLREYAGSESSIWEHLACCIDGIHGANTSTAIETVLKKEGGLLILDGLDEVPDAQNARDNIVPAVHAFSQRFPETQVLVTSRPYAYENDGWALEGFTSTSLAPFDKEQRESFLERWYAHAAPKQGVATVDLESRREALHSQIESQEHLRDLAEVPLLLTLICLLDLHTGGAVPQNREELYDRSVQLLLEVWQKPKFELEATTLQTYLGVTRNDLQNCIEAIAFKFHDEQGHEPGLADIPEGEVLAALRNLAKTNQKGGANTDSLAEYIENRAGLLNHHGSVYRFPHRSFQEYLAARHLSDLVDDDIVSHLREDPAVKWREPFLLAGAKIRKSRVPAAWDLICRVLDSLPKRGARDFTDLDWRIVALLSRLIYEIRFHENESALNSSQLHLLTQVRTHTAALIEHPDQPLPVRERFTAGINLGHIGDPRKGVGCFVNSEEIAISDIVWSSVPAGDFISGDENETVTIPEPYAISRYPLTNQQFAAFIEARGYEDERWWLGETWDGRVFLKDNPRPQPIHYEGPNLPRTNVSWYEAKAFCQWLSQELAIPVDLPSDQQWERAARGAEGRVYPWGDSEKLIETFCNMSETNLNQPSPVGLFPAGAASSGHNTPIEDLCGNVWEWSDSAFDEESKALRGGAFLYYTRIVRSADRYRVNPGNRGSGIGFRVVSSPFETPQT